MNMVIWERPKWFCVWPSFYFSERI